MKTINQSQNRANDLNQPDNTANTKCKKTVFFMLFALAVIFQLGVNHCSAQGSLQFNQALLVSTVQTVPAGKVWKVVSIIGQRTASLVSSGSTSMPSMVAPADHQILINGQSVSFSVESGGVGGTGQYGSFYGWDGSVSTVPFWVPANTSLAASTNVNFISVLEFNIIP